MTRKKTKKINLDFVSIGGDAPIVVQSMTNTDTRDVEATVAQIGELEKAGCEVIRVAVPDKKAVQAIPAIKKRIRLPLIADIHFDYRLAVDAMKSGAAGIRINPGNMAPDKINEVIKVAKERDIVIRIGVNSGSLQKDLLLKYGGATADALVESALQNIERFEDQGFDKIKLSLKSSDVPSMIEAYRAISAKTDYPLHLGVTEAGSLVNAAVKSALGIGTLLYEGIGDTIRVSVTGDPVSEIPLAYGILRALKIRNVGPEIVSCPTCGRCEIDLLKLSGKIEKALAGRKDYLKVALMGCVVNGPGEAADADIGIAGGKGQGILFKKGKVVKKVNEKDFVKVLMKEINLMIEERKKV
ncbi:MAG: 4-hydroxy-3-methylbut-2-en-1-yl diphosphate synthase [Deltaproteobacteria bacterium HGW-Deltaproteobacteria-13]|nr:MAG: 4-hydroxy-3-methylbut-2-en-1-yl diphosphate synthase [Deltaproteobacteria bacterium HGW-Deltaproteobacteria-13]